MRARLAAESRFIGTERLKRAIYAQNADRANVFRYRTVAYVYFLTYILGSICDNMCLWFWTRTKAHSEKECQHIAVEWTTYEGSEYCRFHAMCPMPITTLASLQGAPFPATNESSETGMGWVRTEIMPFDSEEPLARHWVHTDWWFPVGTDDDREGALNIT